MPALAEAAASSTFAVTELHTGSVLATIAANPATDTVYASTTTGTFGIAVINGASNAVTTHINLPSPPPAVIAADPATDTVYGIADAPSSTAAGTAYVIDGGTNAVTATISLPIGLKAQGAAVNPVTHMVYVTDIEHSTVVVIDGSTDAVAATIPLTDPALAPSPSLRGIAVDATTNTIYVADAESSAVSGPSNGEVQVIDGATATVTGRFALPAGVVPVGITADPDADLVYIADDHVGVGAGAVYAIDTSTGSVSTLASGLTQPNRLALDSGTGSLYVASPISTVSGAGLNLGTTYVIDTASGSITAQIPRGGTSVALTPASGGAAYVDDVTLGLLRDAVTVITPSTANTMSPIIVGGGGATFTVGQAGQAQLAASAIPAATFSATGLPGGLSLSPSGLLAGTPAAGMAGAYDVAVTVANGVGPAITQLIDFTVVSLPVFTSANQVVLGTGVAGSVTVTAAGFPAPAFSESGPLPAGIGFSSAGVL